MGNGVKKAYIAAGGAIIVAIIGLISSNMRDKKQNDKNVSINPIELTDNNIKTGDQSPVIIGDGNTIIYGNTTESEDNISNSVQRASEQIDAPATNSTNPDNSEKILVSETHTPNDTVTSVSVINWNSNSDIDIDGNMYDGGLKVIISNMFTSMGSGLENNIISRITIPLSDSQKKSEEKIFSGTFVLDQSMFGSKSSGTIEIIINNKVLFSTGEINGNTNGSFPFNVSYEGADTIIIETNTTLKGSDFVYGIVNSKE